VQAFGKQMNRIPASRLLRFAARRIQHNCAAGEHRLALYQPYQRMNLRMLKRKRAGKDAIRRQSHSLTCIRGDSLPCLLVSSA
jgi:hypothetical protein